MKARLARCLAVLARLGARVAWPPAADAWLETALAQRATRHTHRLIFRDSHR
jgi:hypothetical protein